MGKILIIKNTDFSEIALDQVMLLKTIITVNISPTGGGIVSGSGHYAYGEEITIDAIPSEGYIFYQWSDGDINQTRTIIATEDKTYTAIFIEEKEETLIFDGTDNMYDGEWTPVSVGAFGPQADFSGHFITRVTLYRYNECQNNFYIAKLKLDGTFTILSEVDKDNFNATESLDVSVNTLFYEGEYIVGSYKEPFILSKNMGICTNYGDHITIKISDKTINFATWNGSPGHTCLYPAMKIYGFN